MTSRGVMSGLKRAVDVVGASAGLILLSPVLASAAIAVLVKQGRPVLFRQVRPGLRGKPFTLLKFRTMRSPTPEELRHRTLYETDGDRITRLGRFLRSTSIDELPELWNVLRGEMSLVGPRPLLVEYLEEYTPEEQRRHDVLPGITGWAAVNGRNALKFRDRLKLDVWYVDHWSLWLDLKILTMTIGQVLGRRNVSEVEASAELDFPESTRTTVRDVDVTPGCRTDTGSRSGCSEPQPPTRR